MCILLGRRAEFGLPFFTYIHQYIRALLLYSDPSSRQSHYQELKLSLAAIPMPVGDVQDKRENDNNEKNKITTLFSSLVSLLYSASHALLH